MSDLIDRNDAIEAVYEALRTPLPCYGNNLLQDSMTLAKAIVNNIPSAESERTARVECIAEVYKNEIVDHYLSGICGICGESTYDRAKYCSECGAKLDWSDDE